MDAQLEDLTRRIKAGDENAIGPAFEFFRPRLRSAIRWRLDQRVRSREDESDILQEAYFAAARDLKRYSGEPAVPIYVWLRRLVQQQLAQAHRKHVHAQKRDVDRETSVPTASLSMAGPFNLADHISASITSPSKALSKHELRITLEALLKELDPIDQEILSMRHVESLKSKEIAEVLNLKHSTVSSRYLRALKKLKDGLSEHDILFPG